MLSFMIGELATRPEWQQKIRQEVVEAFGDGETSLEKLEGMKNLNAVMKVRGDGLLCLIAVLTRVAL
jgi:hypothetical protein